MVTGSSRWRGIPFLCALLAPPGAEARAQVIQGTVVDEANGSAVPSIFVALYDSDGDQRAMTMSDSTGFFRLTVPGAGEYRLVAEGLGIDVFRSHLLSIGHRADAYELDLLVRRVPVPIRGLEVSVDRRKAMERSVRLLIGMNPNSLRRPPILRAEIERHLGRGHSLGDLLRWSNTPGLVVRPTDEGPCYELRGACVPVFLNGTRMGREWSELLPLEMAEMVVILLPRESVQFPGGAILLYTAGWIG